MYPPGDTKLRCNACCSACCSGTDEMDCVLTSHGSMWIELMWNESSPLSLSPLSLFYLFYNGVSYIVAVSFSSSTVPSASDGRNDFFIHIICFPAIDSTHFYIIILIG